MPVDQSRQYLRIRDQLAADIAQGVLQVKLPSERELAERFLCTRITLREALQQLETEGLVYRENRRGWFVAPPRIRYNPTRTTGFMEYVSAQGRQPRTETLHAERRAAGAWLAKRMGLEDSAPVYFLPTGGPANTFPGSSSAQMVSPGAWRACGASGPTRPRVRCCPATP
ncbi:GntR family transcriptional regulator [Klebsiella pneumoniae]|uniref:GntR family transcriptional regulator n=1 Tax=Klebsiella pneumoniae TaxID=573 RepID=UPI001B31802C|nr:GntR family transcriptional regulator [Klebsiella pneumoniae]QTT64368.1 GntR family transcriptional regulator [Klebsiella pneumoniae]